MPVYIELTTDLFSDTFSKAKKNMEKSRRAGSDSARRPLRGLEIKEDVHAILKVVDVAGKSIRLFDSSRPDSLDNGEGNNYTNFILQSVQEARMEKSQIIDTFGDAYIFFFGEAPRFIDVQVVLINSHDFNWKAEWWANYDNYFRGSRLTELGARLYMFYDDNIVEGYMLNAQCVDNAQEPLFVTLTFRMFVTNTSNVSLIGSSEFPIRGSVDLPSGVRLNDRQATQILTDMAAEQSRLRGANEAAGFALQQNAFNRFGGGALLAQSIRNGFELTSAGVAQAAFVSAGTLGANPTQALLAAGLAGAAAGPPNAGTGAAADIAFAGTAEGIVQNAGVALGVASAVFGQTNFGRKVKTAATKAFDKLLGIKEKVDVTLPVERTTPLRTSIFDNLDEWTGTFSRDTLPEFTEPEKMSDVASLVTSVLSTVAAFGVAGGGAAVVSAIGLAPKSNASGVGIGAGASNSSQPSFGPSGDTGSNTAGYTSSPKAGTAIGPNGPYPQADPAGSMSFFENAPPPKPYDNYPGYGQGYGSAAGGPGGGYAPGSLGVGSSSGVPISASGAGAGSQVGGVPSAFALESFPGELDPTGGGSDIAKKIEPRQNVTEQS